VYQVTLSLILTDQIPSGKNSMGITQTGRHYAKPRFESWRSIAAYEILRQKMTWCSSLRKCLPLKTDVTVTISYRELEPVPAKGVRDLPGMQDALWHLLTHTGLLANDGQIKGVLWQYPWRTDGPCIIMELRNG
jgi:Holliday junction resolvase RusA-like endonuclease